MLKKFKSTVLLRLYGWLLRVQSWLNIRRFRGTRDVRAKAFNLVMMRIRLLVPEAKQEGADEKVDQIIEIATFKIMLPAYFEYPLPSFIERFDKKAGEARDVVRQYKERRKEVDRLVATVSDDAFIRSLAESAYYAEAVLGAEIKDDEWLAYYAKKAGIEVEDAKLLSESDIRKVEKEYKKEWRGLRGQLQDREALKIDIKLDDVSKYVAIAYAVLLIGAYIRVFVIYDGFGVSVSKFFGVADYLSASLEALGPAAVSSAWGGIVIFLGYFYASRKSVALIRYQASKRRRLDGYRLIILYFTFVFIVSALSDRQLFYRLLQVMVPIVVMHAAWPISERMCARPRPAFFSMYFIAVFLAHIYSGAMIDLDIIKKSDSCYKISAPSLSGYGPCDLSMIGANSNYQFFYSKENANVVVIQRASMEYAEFNHHKQNYDLFTFVQSSISDMKERIASAWRRIAD